MVDPRTVRTWSFRGVFLLITALATFFYLLPHEQAAHQGRAERQEFDAREIGVALRAGDARPGLVDELGRVELRMSPTKRPQCEVAQRRVELGGRIQVLGHR